MTNNKYKMSPGSQSTKNRRFRRRPALLAGMRQALSRKKRRGAGRGREPARKAYDPELLFVECGRCGAPVLWDEGKASALLGSVGIDPLELDPYCLLLTDGCPECLPGRKYKVRILRLGLADGIYNPRCGHA